MSEHDWEKDEWQLDMSLPSRKETHGKRKKKSKTKAEKQAKSEKQPSFFSTLFKKKQPKQTDPITEAQDTSEPPKEDRSFAEQQTVLFVKPHQEFARQSERSLPSDSKRPSQQELPAPPAKQAPKTDTAWQADNLIRAVQSYEAVPELESAKLDLALPNEAEKTAAEKEIQAAVDETAVTDALFLPLSTPSALPGRDEDVQPEMPTDVHPTAETDSAETETKAEDSEAAQQEIEPVLSTWQRRLIMVLTPIIAILVLLYGKIGYVHQIPPLVRQNVPAYAEGEGFLIIKPWWFGPPVLALDQIGNPQVGDLDLYKASLGDYESVLEKPIILHTYAQDLLK